MRFFKEQLAKQFTMYNNYWAIICSRFISKSISANQFTIYNDYWVVIIYSQFINKNFSKFISANKFTIYNAYWADVWDFVPQVEQMCWNLILSFDSDRFSACWVISCVWHDSLYATWLIHTCDMTHSFICGTWLIRNLLLPFDSDRSSACWVISCVWHDSFMYATWLIHSYVWHDSFEISYSPSIQTALQRAESLLTIASWCLRIFTVGSANCSKCQEISRSHLAPYIYVYMHICMYAYVYMCIFMYTCLYECKFMYIYIYLYLYIYIYIYIYRNIYTYTHVYIHIYTYSKCNEISRAHVALQFTLLFSTLQSIHRKKI